MNKSAVDKEHKLFTSFMRKQQQYLCPSAASKYYN